MSTVLEIRLQTGAPQTFRTTLGGVQYQLTLRFRGITEITGSDQPVGQSFTADSEEVTADNTEVTADYSDTSNLPAAPDPQQESWVLDISDTDGNDLLTGLPLVTGINLLEQYRYLNFGGGLYVQTTSDPDAVPTFENLGDDGLLYWVV